MRSPFDFAPAPGVLPPGSVSNAELAPMAARTVKANPTNATDQPQDVQSSAAGQYFGSTATTLLWKQIAASEVANTPAGNIAANDVQGALNELDAEKAGLALANIFTQTQTVNLNSAALGSGFTPGFSVQGADSGSTIGVVLRGTGSVQMFGQRTNGTIAAPSALTGGQNFFQFGAGGYTGATYATVPGQLRFRTTENWSSTNQGCQIDVFTLKNAAAGQNQWTFGQDGCLTCPGMTTQGAGTVSVTQLFVQNNVAVDATRLLRARVYTVATLPTAVGIQGAIAHVSDSLAPAFGVAVAGGGAVSVPVYSDNTNWIVG